MKAKNFSRLGDTQDQRLSVARGGRQFYTARAEDIDAARSLPFHKQDCALRKCTCVFNPLQMFERRLREIAEEAGMSELANKTVFRDLNAVGRTHSTPRGA